MGADKRRFKRFAFPKDSDIKATLVPVGGEGAVEATILNVSSGGIGLAAEKNNHNGLCEEVELLFENVTEGAGLPCLKGQLVKIKWILDYEPLANFGIGCEFVDLKDDCAKELNALFQ